ncbi:transposase [Actinomadura barringtoniae]|uniref:Transposase n=1 Tax=Actinomadura barringtoniae TaxID=1427535 RepID=A0A939PIF2_9ACTN|nr:transposase [Actinomadura barringtoniae]MBO2453296.1 transposase [Actinomadura barringtoniae]
MFTAIVYVLISGCARRHLPGEFRVSPSTAHSRFMFWTHEGLWPRPHQAVLGEFGAYSEVDWSSAIVDASTPASAGAGYGPRLTAGSSSD